MLTATRIAGYVALAFQGSPAMTQKEILALIEEIARGLGLVASTNGLTPRSIISELGIDSLAMAQIVLDVERRLGVAIPDGELTDIVTVEDLVRVVEHRLAEGSRPLDGSALRH